MFCQPSAFTTDNVSFDVCLLQRSMDDLRQCRRLDVIYQHDHKFRITEKRAQLHDALVEYYTPSAAGDGSPTYGHSVRTSLRHCHK
jgi:hypothetical protein